MSRTPCQRSAEELKEYVRNYYRDNRERILNSNRNKYKKKAKQKYDKERYQKDKETRKIYITLNGQYIEGIWHDYFSGWKHCTTTNKNEAFKYNFYSFNRVKKYYESIGVEVGFEFVKEKDNE